MVISKVRDIRARQLFHSGSECVHIRQGAFHTCDRYGTALTAVETHPYRATVFKKNLQRTPNHNYSACHVKSFSSWNLFPSLHHQLEKKLCKQQYFFFLLASQWQTKRRKGTLIDVCSCCVVSFVHMQHVAPPLRLQFPRENAAICYTQQLSRC